MATGKKSFVLYADLIHVVRKLPKAARGDLLLIILEYVNDELDVVKAMEEIDILLSVTFEPIKQQLKRDLKKYEAKKTNFSDAGKESAKARRLIGTQLYVLKFYNDNEEFIKVGITDSSIGRRYSSSGDGGYKLGYKFDIIYQYFEDSNIISVLELESKIRQKFGHNKYSPSHNFAGHMECYCIESLNEIIKYLESFNIVQHRSTFSTVNVNDNVNVNVIKEKEEKETFSPPPLKVKKRSQPDALQFPFSGIEFMKAWNELMTFPKWKKKPLSAIQQSLDNIAKYDEEFAVKQINDAHAGDWQGLTFQDTDEKFLKWKNQQNGQTIKTNPGGKLTGTYQAAEDFAREIEEKSRNFVSPLRNSSPLN